MEYVPNSNIEMKHCVVELERLEIDRYDDSSDSMDDPSLLFTYSSTRKKKKSKKSTAELLKEHQNLAQNLIVDYESLTNTEEAIRRLNIKTQIQDTDDRSSVTPDPVPFEEIDVKIFCVKDSLQFFNSRDVTPEQCGYANRCHDSFPVCIFEREMLSFKRVEFEHVISSFLLSAKECCVSDFKSFVTFLLRTLSVHNDIDCISACYRILVSLLSSHPDSSCLTFSSAEIFMLLFNYGVDIDSFKLFSKWTDIKKNLEVPQYQSKNSSGIPVKWFFNLKVMLKAFIKLIPSCTFKDNEMEKIIIFFMWMSTDSSLLKENLYCTVCDCIYVCLETISEDKWNKSQCNIVNDLISLESTSVHERWTNIYRLTESIPYRGKRGIQLCKQISFFSLKCLCLGSSQDLDENSLGFHIKELQFLIQQLVEINCDLLKYASKFVDNCLKNLNASKEEYNELCDLLKHCEASFSEKALNEKTLFSKMKAKLSTFCGQKFSLYERPSMFNLVNIKSESDNNQECSENDYCSTSHYPEARDSPCNSEISGIDWDSFAPNLSEDSLSCSKSDHVNSLSSKENSNEVHIKSEYTDESCTSGTIKKKESRSSSRNSLVNPNLMNSDIKCENLSMQSSEFECKLLNDASSAVMQNKTDNLDVPGSDFVISDFSVEYSEEIGSVKMETDQYYVPISPVAEKMDIADNDNLGNKSPSISENYENQNLFLDDQPPLPEIYEVKSIALSNMDDVKQSTTLTPDLLCDSTNTSNISRKVVYESSSLEVPLTKKSVVLSNYEIPMLCNESEPQIIAYEGGILNPSIMPDTNLSSIVEKPAYQKFCALEKDISGPLSEGTVTIQPSTSSVPTIDENSLLEDDGDIVFIQEKISPKKFSKPDKKENILPSSVQKYSEILSEISITPIKDVPSSSVVACKNNSENDDDILIIEEKTPEKKNSDIIFLEKVSSPSQIKSSLSPILKPQSNNKCESDKTEDDSISTKLNVVPQAEVSKSCFDSQENSSDSEDIVLVDVIVKGLEPITSTEAKSPQIMDNHVVSSENKSVVDISHSKSESSNPQCQEVLNSVLKQIDIKKNTFDSQCNEVLNSILESIVPVKGHVNVNDIVSNSFDVDSNNKQLVSDDQNTHLAKKSMSDGDLTIHLPTHLSTVEGNSEIGQENLDELNENVTFFRMISNNLKRFTNKEFNEKSMPGASGCLNSADISDVNVSRLNIDNNNCSSRTDMSALTNEISDNSENRIIELHPPSSQNFNNDLQDNNNTTISDMLNKLVEGTESNFKLEQASGLDFTNASSNLVKSPVTVNDSILGSNVAKQTDVLKIDASLNIITSSYVNSVPEISESNVLDNTEIKNHNVNKLTKIIPDINGKNLVPCVNPSDKSVIQNNAENNSISGDSTQNLKSSCKSNILSLSNQNQIISVCNTKIILDSLFKSASAKKTFSNQKRANESVSGVAKKSCKNRLAIESLTERKGLLKVYTSPSSIIRRKRSWSENRGDMTSSPRKSKKKYSPVKSPLSAKYSNHKSPRKFFDYAHMKQKYKHFNRKSVLSKAGLNITNVLRERLSPNHSSSNQENHTLDSVDSDITELYTDPKRYADKDCLVIFESQDIVILDSD